MSKLAKDGFYNTSFSGTDMVATIQITGTSTLNGQHIVGSLQTLSYSIHMERQPIRAIGNINAKDYVMGPRTIAGSLVFAVFDKHFAYDLVNEIKKDDASYTFLADELPPFNITITFANEYGKRAKLTIYGVRLVNEGQVMSINDIFTENTYQYVATDIDYLTDIDSDDKTATLFPGQNFPSPSTSPDGSLYQDIKLDTTEENNTYEEPEITYELTHIISDKTPDRVGFKLNPVPVSGAIQVYSLEDGTPNLIDIKKDSQFPLYRKFEPGSYRAQYWLEGKSRSNQVVFSIAATKQPEVVAIPIVTRITNTSITVKLDKKQWGVYYRSMSLIPGEIANKWEYLALGPRIDGIIEIKDLKPYTRYQIKATKNDIDSAEIIVTTLYRSSEDLFKELILFNEDHPVLKENPETVKRFLNATDAFLAMNPNVSLTDAFAIVQMPYREVTHPRIRYFLANQARRFEDGLLEAYSPYHIEGVEIKDCYSGRIELPIDTDQVIIESNSEPKRVVSRSKLVKQRHAEGVTKSYTLPANPGVYRITRQNQEKTSSMPQQMLIVDNDYRQKEIANTEALAIRKLQVQTAVLQEAALFADTLDAYDRELFANQWSMQKQGECETLLQPEVTVNNQEVEISLNYANKALSENLYLCYESTRDVLDQNLVRKVATHRDQDYKCVLEASQLVLGRRYTVWYQDIETGTKYKPSTFVFDPSYDFSVTIDDKLFDAEHKLLMSYLNTAINKYNCYHIKEFIQTRFDSCLQLNRNNMQTVIADTLVMISAEDYITKEDLCFTVLVLLEIERLMVNSTRSDDFIKVIYDKHQKQFGVTLNNMTGIHVLKGYLYKGELTYLPVEAVSEAWQTNLSFCPNGAVAFMSFCCKASGLVLSPIAIDVTPNTQVFGKPVEGGRL